MSDTPTPKKYGGRAELLSTSGKRTESEVTVNDVTYIVRELTGAERARVLGEMAKARLDKNVNLERYQRMLLLYGVVDPESPEGARTPAFTDSDMAAVMENGAGLLDPLLEKIEELSGLSIDEKKAEQMEKAADDFFGGTPKGASTSDSPES